MGTDYFLTTSHLTVRQQPHLFHLRDSHPYHLRLYRTPIVTDMYSLVCNPTWG